MTGSEKSRGSRALARGGAWRDLVLAGLPMVLICAATIASVPLAGAAGESPAPAEPGVLPLSSVEHRPSEAAQSLRAGDAKAWEEVPETVLKLNRTPPLYDGDPMDRGTSPPTRVAVVRVDSSLLLRIQWEDDSDDAIPPPRRLPDVGADGIYKQHSRGLDQFTDAVCVMVPRERGPRQQYPPLMMGGREDPVDLFYWHQERGFQWLGAHGRASTASTGHEVEGSARRWERGWSVVFELTGVAPRTPISFAVWNGSEQQRDGLKYYSPWYEVGR